VWVWLTSSRLPRRDDRKRTRCRSVTPGLRDFGSGSRAAVTMPAGPRTVCPQMRTRRCGAGRRRPGGGRQPSCREPDSEGGAGSAIRDDQGTVDRACSWHVLTDLTDFDLANPEPQMFVCEGNVVQLHPYVHAQLNRWIRLFVIVAGGPTSSARLLIYDDAANPRTRK
jgi:hypothetical protein